MGICINLKCGHLYPRRDHQLLSGWPLSPVICFFIYGKEQILVINYICTTVVWQISGMVCMILKTNLLAIFKIFYLPIINLTPSEIRGWLCSCCLLWPPTPFAPRNPSNTHQSALETASAGSSPQKGKNPTVNFYWKPGVFFWLSQLTLVKLRNTKYSLLLTELAGKKSHL